MPIIEYMLHKTKEGSEIPDFVARHIGRKNSQKRYLGWVPTQRNWYVPNTVKVLDKEKFVERELERRLGNERREEEGDDPNEPVFVVLDKVELTAILEQEYDVLVEQFGE